MEQNESLIPSEQKVKALIMLELTKLFGNIQKIIQEAADIQFDKNNLKEDHQPLKKLRKLVTEANAIIKAQGKPYYTAYKMWNDAGKQFIEPLSKVLDEKTKQFTELAESLRKENELIEQQNRLTLAIRDDISRFVNETTFKITSANTHLEIANIQKLIGSEKSREKHYGNQLNDLKTACDGLNPLINKRKEFIKADIALEEEQKKASETGNQDKLIELAEKKESLNEEIQENALRLQEKAFEEIINVPKIEITESMSESVKARRSAWKWEIEDIELLKKKMPDLVELCPIKSKINELLDAKKADGSLNGIDKLDFNGIIFYLEKRY